MQKTFKYALINNLFVMYCVLFRHFDFFGLLFLLYLEIAIEVPFRISLAERLPVNKQINNDLKFSGELAYWDERKYRGKTEYFYTYGNLLLLAVLYIFMMGVPLFIIPQKEMARLTASDLFPFRSLWFLGCVLVILIRYTGEHIYRIKFKNTDGLYFEDFMKLDYFKYWLILAFIIIGFSAIGILQSQIEYNSYMGVITFSILYFIVKSILDYRNVIKKDKSSEIEI